MMGYPNKVPHCFYFDSMVMLGTVVSDIGDILSPKAYQIQILGSKLITKKLLMLC